VVIPPNFYSLVITVKLLKAHPLLTLANSYLIDSPAPSNLSYLWNFGSLLGTCLALQIITGVTLAMHYSASTDLAFLSVEHLVRDVPSGWLIRNLHANGAAFFFVFVYIHMGKGLYYGSYRKPRVLLWSIGVAIFLIMIVTAFLGTTETCLKWFDGLKFKMVLPFTSPPVSDHGPSSGGRGLKLKLLIVLVHILVRL